MFGKKVEVSLRLFDIFKKNMVFIFLCKNLRTHRLKKCNSVKTQDLMKLRLAKTTSYVSRKDFIWNICALYLKLHVQSYNLQKNLSFWLFLYNCNHFWTNYATDTWLVSNGSSFWDSLSWNAHLKLQINLWTVNQLLIKTFIKKPLALKHFFGIQ